MANFLKASEAEGQIARGVSDQLRDRELWIVRETEAAILMQTSFRSCKAYHCRKNQAYMAREIQRLMRGFFGRKRFRERKKGYVLSCERLIFDFYAEQIQKMWRGYRSRRYKHDFWARKKYLGAVKRRGEELREELETHMKNQERIAKTKEESNRKKELESVTRNLHHLLSTKSCPGIYKNPYFEHSQPRINGVPVEDHLRSAFKDKARDEMRRQKRLLKKSLKRAGKIRNQSMKTIRISTTYDEDIQRRRMEDRLNKLKRVGPRDFLVATRSSRESKLVPLNAGDPYVDPCKRFLSTKQLQEKNKDARVSKKPFILAVRSRRPISETACQ